MTLGSHPTDLSCHLRRRSRSANERVAIGVQLAADSRIHKNLRVQKERLNYIRWCNITHMVKGVKSDRPPLHAAQIRAARALLRWSAEELAQASALGANTVRRAEVAEGATALTAANDRAIRKALEEAGVEFIDPNGGGAGVRFRDPRG